MCAQYENRAQTEHLKNIQKRNQGDKEAVDTVHSMYTWWIKIDLYLYNTIMLVFVMKELL